MKFEIIWPVIALLIGWLLGELSGAFKTAHSKRAELRCVIFKLLSLLDDVNLFIHLSKQFPEDAEKLDSVEDADKLLKTLFNRWNSNFNDLEKNMGTLTVPIARFDPCLAHKLEALLVSLKSLTKSKIKGGVANENNLKSFMVFASFILKCGVNPEPCRQCQGDYLDGYISLHLFFNPGW